MIKYITQNRMYHSIVASKDENTENTTTSEEEKKKKKISNSFLSWKKKWHDENEKIWKRRTIFDANCWRSNARC